jgi:hypothetical protein
MDLYASDRRLGRVEQCYFDDQTWALRFLIVRAGSWLAGRRVLLPPWSVKSVDWPRRHLTVSLTSDQLRNLPPMHDVAPVSHEREREYLRYFDQPSDWTYGFGVAVALWELEPAARAAAIEDEARGILPSNHLRSSADVTGYHIQATDGRGGVLRDFLVDDETWRVRGLVVDTGDRFGTHRVVVATDAIERISWGHRAVFVRLPRRAVADSESYAVTAH